MPLPKPCLLVALLPILLSAPTLHAQQDSSSIQPQQSKPASSTAPPYRTPGPGGDNEMSGAYGFLYRGQYACGTGVATSSVSSTPTGMCGLGFVGPFPFLVTEFGVMGPQAHHSSVSAYLSEDLVLPIAPKSTLKWHGHPLLIVGYTRMFETGHALDYGIGYERHIDAIHSLQFELRDYDAFANPNMHNVFFRVVWVTGVPD